MKLLLQTPQVTEIKQKSDFKREASTQLVRFAYKASPPSGFANGYRDRAFGKMWPGIAGIRTADPGLVEEKGKKTRVLERAKMSSLPLLEFNIFSLARLGDL